MKAVSSDAFREGWSVRARKDTPFKKACDRPDTPLRGRKVFDAGWSIRDCPQSERLRSADLSPSLRMIFSRLA
jgi:hypothetical protein